MEESLKKYSLTNPFRDNLTFIESLSQLDDTSTFLDDEDLASLDLETDIQLPIHAYEEEIKQSIRENKCVILTGSTGCGKTTQLPKFIVKDCSERNQNFNILVSQPRKIAAITNATRVAQELKVSLGSLVGFQVSLHKKINQVGNHTKVLFCSTGVILQKLIRNKSMRLYTHIILDEIHERDIEMDFLLILVRLFLNTNSPDTKVILMSATMDSQRFASYFRSNTVQVPVIIMREERNFDLKKVFLDDIHRGKDKLISDFESPSISESMMLLAVEIIFQHVQKDKKSSILVFLPGFYEIENFERTLLHKFDVFSNYQLIILHSSLPPSNQKLAFKVDNKPKIILSTNIAENSVTFPMVNVVVDFCLTKYLVASKDSNLASLKLNWTSRMSSEQRAGRTGRVCDGIVYHLVPRNFYDNEMLQWTEPEMMRVPLERVILKTKMLTNRSPKNFLAGALDPPNFENVRNSVLVLKEIGALQRYDANGNFQDCDGELTYCGRILASLPCDVFIGKFIVLGYLFSVLKEAIIIGAGLNINGTIFKFDYRKRLETYSSRLSWSDGSGSDLIAILNAYNLWQKSEENEAFKQPNVRQRWCDRFNLDLKNLCEMKELIGEISYRLDENRMWLLAGENFQPILEEKEKTMMLKVCAAGAWLPYYFIQEQPQEDSEHAAYKQVDNLSVHRTIFFRDREQKYIELYSDILKQSLIENGICENFNDIKVHFDEEKGSTKILVSFTREETMMNKKDNRGIMLVDGMILPEVYVATKLKMLKQGNYILNVMDHSSMKKYARQIGYIDEPLRDVSVLNQSSASSFTLGHDEMKGIVTNVVHCGKFFFQPTGPKYDNDNRLMSFKLKISQLDPITSEMELTNEDFVIVRFNDVLQRGIVFKPVSHLPIQFHLIDLGIITTDVRLEDVHHCPKSLRMQFELPPRCFECSLMELAPSFSHCPNGVWTKESVDHLKSLVMDKKMEVKIFSVVDEVVSVELFESNEEVSVNELMIESNYAMKREEDYLSRLNNEERRSSCLSFIGSTVTLTTNNDESMKKPKPSRLVPPKGMSNSVINLSGPHTPLETSLKGILAVENYNVTIDAVSVNSVVLNGDINEATSARLYVAANVSINRNNGITLRELTMMPRVPGLSEILAMIFCPKMVLRRSDDKLHYVSLQTGLGLNPQTGEGLLALHDTLFDVSVRFTEEDFQNINELRQCMSHLLFTPPHEEFPPLTARQKYNLLDDVKRLVSTILKTERQISRVSKFLGGKDYSWIESDSEDVERPTDPFIGRGIYPQHSYPKLKEIPKETFEDIKKNLKDLEKAADSRAKTTSQYCQLCKVYLHDARELSDHLMSTLHKKLVKDSYKKISAV